MDTGTNPLRVRKRSDINEEKDFWITPTFGGQEGKIGLRKWPEMNTMKAGKWWTKKGAVINVDMSDTGAYRDDFKFERVGEDSIILSHENYFVVSGKENELRATGTKETATRFKVLRLKERLRTRMRGVNMASWFLPESVTNAPFFNFKIEKQEPFTDL